MANVNLSRTDLVDHHAHVFSPVARQLFENAIQKAVPPLTPNELIPVMQKDGVAKAAVFSVAYMFASPQAGNPDLNSLKAENDWVANRVVEHPDQLVGFFSVNPVASGSAAEIERCRSLGKFAGLKLHLANSDVDLRHPEHVDQLAETFELANSLGLPIAIHLRTRRVDYGREDAQIFMERVLPKAMDVVVQIAHVGGWSGYDEATDEALGAFTDWIDLEPLIPRVYFDLSAVVKRVGRDERKSSAERSGNRWRPERRHGRLVERLRKIGLDRVLFGTDWPEWTPRMYAMDLANSLPLNTEELHRVFANRAPWLG